MRESNEIKVRTSNARTWIVLLICAAILLALLLPAIQSVQQDARRLESTNNLKQLAFACLNYESSYKCLPLGADFDPFGNAKHGWTMRLIPYLEQTALFNEISMRVAWDSPFNRYLMRQTTISLQRSGQPKSSAEGLALQHYMGNPNVFHRSHTVKFSDMTSGTSNQWLFGEVDGAYQPWGYPFNWRPLNPPFNTGQGNYGAWHEGFQIAMADGSVQFLSQEADIQIINALATAPPVASEEQTTVPVRRFAYAKSELKHKFIEQKRSELHKGWRGALIHYDATGKVDCVNMTHVTSKAPEHSEDGTQSLFLKDLIRDFPSMRELITGRMLDDETAKQIAKLRSLELLCVSRVQLSSKGIELLGRIKTLKSLAFHIRNDPGDLEMLEAVRKRLPGCVVSVLTMKVD